MGVRVVVGEGHCFPGSNRTEVRSRLCVDRLKFSREGQKPTPKKRWKRPALETINPTACERGR